MSPIYTGEKVFLQDVGPRDGLQSERQILSPEVRAGLVERLAAAGLTRIQIGSFVNPKLVPQLAGTDQLWRCLAKRPGVRYSVLVLSERGLEQAVIAGIPHVEIYASASESHSRRNSNASVDSAVTAACRMIERARDSGMGVTAGVMCAFGCFYEGEVPIDKVVAMAKALQDRGPTEIGLADTTGMGDPDLVRRVIERLHRDVSPDRITLHLHDTEGMGLANLRQAVNLGVRRFDASIGGLGGCPFVPGAKGNISTEDAVMELEALGYETGIDLNRIRIVRQELDRLLGEARAEVQTQ